MRVWRVAHETARTAGFPSGPYACTGDVPEHVTHALDDMRYDHCDNEHPPPGFAYSGLPEIRIIERCGFDSREALYEWFKGYEELLHDCGFRVFVYDVPAEAVRVGEFGQAVFVAREAHEISREEIARSPAQLSLF